jgi:hypothetical protein
MREARPKSGTGWQGACRDYCHGHSLARSGPFSRFKRMASPFEWRSAMTIRHLNNRHYDWKHIIDYETFWILTFSAVVLGSGFFALLSISQNNPNALP